MEAENVTEYALVNALTQPHMESYVGLMARSYERFKTFKENVEIAAEYLESNPDEGLPYMSIVKFREEGEDGFEYGDGDVFDADFSELPKYVQKKCAELIAYELSDK